MTATTIATANHGHAPPIHSSPSSAAIEAVEQVLVKGDLSLLTSEERLVYYRQVCQSLGLNPLTKPFEYMNLGGKLVLYCTKDGVAQLRRNHNVSIEIVSQTVADDLLTVHARAIVPGGAGKTKRTDEDFGVVSIAGLKGEARANAALKAITKAKRRVTLSICGLGFLDESEVDVAEQPRSGYVVVPEVDQPLLPQLPNATVSVSDASPHTQTASEQQVAELARLKGELKIPTEEWKGRILAKRGVSTARDLSPGQADELIAKLRHMIAANDLEQGLPAGWNPPGGMAGQHQQRGADDLSVILPGSSVSKQEAPAAAGAAFRN